MSKLQRKQRAKLPVWQRRALAEKDFIDHKMSTWYGRMHLRFLFLMAMVIVKRVKVANQLHSMTDAALANAAQRFIDFITGNSYFTTPSPVLIAVAAALTEFITAVTGAANRDKDKVSIKNAKRLALMNILASLSNYVEDVANDPSNVVAGAVEVIESAGMRARPITLRGKQIWEVMRGPFPNSLLLTAAKIRRGTHDWQYTVTPTDEASWISVTSTTKAKTVISGLTPATYVYCRHRTVTKDGNSAWEGHDPVIVV